MSPWVKVYPRRFRRFGGMVWGCERERDKGQKHTWHISTQKAYWYTRKASRPQLDIVRLNQHTYPSQGAGQMLNCSLGALTTTEAGAGPVTPQWSTITAPGTIEGNGSGEEWEWEIVGWGAPAEGEKHPELVPRTLGHHCLVTGGTVGPFFFFLRGFLCREQRTKGSLHTARTSGHTANLLCGPEFQLCAGSWTRTLVCLPLLFLFICFDLFLAIKCHSPAGHESSLPLTDCGDASLFILPEPVVHAWQPILTFLCKINWSGNHAVCFKREKGAFKVSPTMLCTHLFLC